VNALGVRDRSSAELTLPQQSRLAFCTAFCPAANARSRAIPNFLGKCARAPRYWRRPTSAALPTKLQRPDLARGASLFRSRGCHRVRIVTRGAKCPPHPSDMPKQSAGMISAATEIFSRRGFSVSKGYWTLNRRVAVHWRQVTGFMTTKDLTPDNDPLTQLI
jgi:hypothetical protein